MRRFNPFLSVLVFALGMWIGIGAQIAGSVLAGLVSVLLLFIGYRLLASALQFDSDAEKLQRGRVR